MKKHKERAQSIIKMRNGQIFLVKEDRNFLMERFRTNEHKLVFTLAHSGKQKTYEKDLIVSIQSLWH